MIEQRITSACEPVCPARVAELVRLRLRLRLRLMDLRDLATRGAAPRPHRACLHRTCWALCFLPLMAAGCADGTLVVLGDRDPSNPRFAPPESIAELASSAKSDNPSLTADLLEIYFTSERGGAPADIWSATRSDPGAPFDAPRTVVELSSSDIETSPIVSADGLTCWLASDRPGGLGDLDIWVATRGTRGAAWSTPRPVPELSSAGKDIPRPPGQHGLVMPLGSDRDTRGFYQIYFAHRTFPRAEFSAPELVEELSEPSASTVDGYLTDDGLDLFYVRGPAFGPADLFVAQRRTPQEPFTRSAELSELNTPDDERDPFLSADKRWLYFSSNRSGEYEIYVAKVEPPED